MASKMGLNTLRKHKWKTPLLTGILLAHLLAAGGCMPYDADKALRQRTRRAMESMAASGGPYESYLRRAV